MEHAGRLSIRCNKVDANDFFELRLFANLLIGSAFTCYVNLLPNSIFT